TFAGARQRTRGCSPRGLGGVFVLAQGLKNVVPPGSFAGMAVQRLFQPASAFSELVQRPGVQLDPQGSTCQQRRVWFRHVESSRLTIVDLFEGVVLNHGVRGAPEPRPVRRRSGEPSTLITTLVALSQGGGVKRTMPPMPGPRAMAASVSY